MTVAINQIVKARGESQFVVIGTRMIDGEQYAQVKPYRDGNAGPGEFALPVSILREA